MLSAVSIPTRDLRVKLPLYVISPLEGLYVEGLSG